MKLDSENSVVLTKIINSNINSNNKEGIYDLIKLVNKNIILYYNL